MSELLTSGGYEQTKSKLAQLRSRRAALLERTDLKRVHHELALRSYDDMIRQYLRDIKLYEAAHHLPTSK